MTAVSDCATYLVKGEKDVLIDCGSGEAHEKLVENIEKAGGDVMNIDCVIGTHGHYDHLAGLEKLRAMNPSIRLAMRREDAGQIETGDPELTCAEWFFGAEMPGQKVDVIFDSDQIFSAGGMDFEIMHTPGHTPGSICIKLDIDDKLALFTGDCISPGNDRVRSDREDWEATLDMLHNEDFDLLLPGHANNWVMDPFTLALTAKSFLGGPADAAFDFLRKRLTNQIWTFFTFNYSHITPVLARFGAKKK